MGPDGGGVSGSTGWNTGSARSIAGVRNIRAYSESGPVVPMGAQQASSPGRSACRSRPSSVTASNANPTRGSSCRNRWSRSCAGVAPARRGGGQRAAMSASVCSMDSPSLRQSRMNRPMRRKSNGVSGVGGVVGLAYARLICDVSAGAPATSMTMSCMIWS